jgi:hypothetical protein
MSSPTASPSTNTALKLSRTDARGWWVGTIAGWTLTATSGTPSGPSPASATARSFTA